MQINTCYVKLLLLLFRFSKKKRILYCGQQPASLTQVGWTMAPPPSVPRPQTTGKENWFCDIHVSCFLNIAMIFKKCAYNAYKVCLPKI